MNLIQVINFNIVKIVILFASNFPLFQNGDHQSRLKVVDSQNVEILQIIQSVENLLISKPKFSTL